jgi:heat shock protein HslJ
MKLTISAFLMTAALVLGGCRDWFPPIDPTDPKGPKDTAYVDPNDDGSAKRLAGTRWCLSIVEGSGIRDTLYGRFGRYIEFDGNGRASGSGGFNDCTGDYTAKNGSIDISNVVHTKILGDNTENQFFALMDIADRYSISADNLNLKLYSAGTAGALYFERCGIDTVVTGNQVQVPLDQEFKLGYQTMAEITGTVPGLFVTVQSVTNDSRCPVGVQCVWEGDATVTVTLIQDGSLFSGELHTNVSVGPRTQTLGDYDVELIDLLPYPVANQIINPSEYVTVLRVTKH